MNISYTSIYNDVYACLNSSEFDHEVLHKASIEITDAIWGLYRVSNKIPNSGLINIIRAFAYNAVK